MSKKELQKRLNEGFTKQSQTPKEQASKPEPSQENMVEGYKMEDMNPQDETTELSSSGVQWFASVFIFFMIGLFVYGMRRSK